MVQEDPEGDQMFVQLSKSNPFCGKCLCMMESTDNLKEFKCKKCGAVYKDK